MATYQQVQEYVKERHGFVPKTCWIAHCRDIHGLGSRSAPNRLGSQRVHPRPPTKRPAIEEASEHLKMLPRR
jgi:hypothetical protein